MVEYSWLRSIYTYGWEHSLQNNYLVILLVWTWIETSEPLGITYYEVYIIKGIRAMGWPGSYILASQFSVKMGGRRWLLVWRRCNMHQGLNSSDNTGLGPIQGLISRPCSALSFANCCTHLGLGVPPLVCNGPRYIRDG